MMSEDAATLYTKYLASQSSMSKCSIITPLTAWHSFLVEIFLLTLQIFLQMLQIFFGFRLSPG